ncbi:hypothetical protein [Pseudonocardia acidicola]|uniref:Uncharacterized protein n=1 Tax=Pseudonocardia acidicola TaxID=2724939 RepID=A0ABX1SHC7_9PSEU|nr:hypothetical protein [Pseudonocardia acidicola]NMI00178.1 hypothetical protein [Pseudonocardia acidicola]
MTGRRGQGAAAPAGSAGPELRVENEYAGVRVAVDTTANGSRLRVTSQRSNREIFLDPTALDLLCHARQEFWAFLADAARDSQAWDALRPEYRTHFPSFKE